MKYRYLLLLVLLLGVTTHAQGQTLKTQNVILIMTDGLRWQEVFGGADAQMMNKEHGNITDLASARKAYWRDTPEERREALMPFFWSVFAKQGQVFGNGLKGSVAHVTNGKNFSYPGYSETLCGYPDPRINSNNKIPNANVTVFEWLNTMPKYRGKVAAFGAWDVFPSIFNSARAGFVINAGYDPLILPKPNAKIDLLNRLKAESPRYWEGEPYDAYTFHTAIEYLKTYKPRLFFLSLGETDEWAHEGKYAPYLESAKRADSYVQQIWELVQSIPQYRDKTTLIFMPDHGRGDAPDAWRNHSAVTTGSDKIWMAFLGPDTPALGERTNIPTVTQSQIAATIAKLLNEDYTTAVPKAGKPIAEVLSKH